MIIKILFLSFIFSLLTSKAQSCSILTSNGGIAGRLNDLFYSVVSQLKSCPENIDSLNAVLNPYLHNRKYVVSNRGRNNSQLGSFSIFETYSAKNQLNDVGIFLGHFTKLEYQSGQVVIELDQSPNIGKLVLELISWDSVKGYYNFYELIGKGNFAQWFYRGDSKDILIDNRYIYLNSTPKTPPIGQTLRCSGCHISGGPILKEINFPHNDWWTTSRPLIFKQSLSKSFLQRLQLIDTAENFAEKVKRAIYKLENSPSYQVIKKPLGLQNQLRPLFCDLEINIESDIFPLDNASQIQIPTSSLLGIFSRNISFTLPKNIYLGFLQKFNIKFPENQDVDADHAWLTPVKGYSDLAAIDHLKKSGLIDDKLLLDVYYSAPIGSFMNREKCELLKLVPLKNSKNWKSDFLINLKKTPSSLAQNLFQRMMNNTINPISYQSKLQEKAREVTLKLHSGQGDFFFQQLIQNRLAVFQSEISKNQRGQILEPGFRVIFPWPKNSRK